MAVAKSGRIWRLAGVFAACALALCACADRGDAEKAPLPGDRAVAKVDGRTIWASDVKREAVAQGLISEGEPLDASYDLFHRVMDEVVDQRLLAAEAIKRKLDKDPAAQRRLAAARERILGDMLVEREVTGAVDEAAVRGLYQEQLKLAKQSEQIRARQIVVATAGEAEAVKNLLDSGASFEALALERSIDAATRFSGGDLGYFTTDVMPAAYDTVLKAAKVGDVVGPFKIDNGWAVAKVEDRKLEDPITLDVARPQIVRFLTYDQIRDLLEKLRNRAKIQHLLPPTPDTAGKPREPASAPPPTPATPPPAAAAPPTPQAPAAEGLRK